MRGEIRGQIKIEIGLGRLESPWPGNWNAVGSRGVGDDLVVWFNGGRKYSLAKSAC